MPKRRISSKAKGKRGELMLANLFKSWGFPAARTVQHSGRGGGPFDVEAPSMPVPHWECKFVEELNIRAAMARAEEDAGDRIWGLATRVKHKKWIFCMNEDAFRRLLIEALAWAEYAKKLEHEAASKFNWCSNGTNEEKASKPADAFLPTPEL